MFFFWICMSHNFGYMPRHVPCFARGNCHYAIQQGILVPGRMCMRSFGGYSQCKPTVIGINMSDLMKIPCTRKWVVVGNTGNQSDIYIVYLHSRSKRFQFMFLWSESTTKIKSKIIGGSPVFRYCLNLKSHYIDSLWSRSKMNVRVYSTKS